MTRLDRLSENTLYEELRQLQVDFRELKYTQPTSGKSGVRTYESETGRTWDYDGTIPNGSREITVTFTGNGSQTQPIVNGYMFMYMGMINQEAWSFPQYSSIQGGLYYEDSDGAAVTVRKLMEIDESLAGDPLKTRWKTLILNTGNICRIRLKVRVRGTCAGYIEVNVK